MATLTHIVLLAINASIEVKNEGAYRVAKRLLSDDISKSKKLPALSPDALNLFFLLIPHFTVHGKMLGDPYFIKGKVCPRFERFTPQTIELMLIEISGKTSVKWFQVDGLSYIHSLNNTTHQPGLRKDRSGKDTLPNFSGENTEPLENNEVPESSGSSPGELPLGSRSRSRSRRECACEEFWKTYPSRNGKKIGKAECLKFIKDEDKLKEKDIPALLVAVKNYAASKQAKENFAKDPIRFLKKDFWREWTEPETSTNKSIKHDNDPCRICSSTKWKSIIDGVCNVCREKRKS